MVAKLPEQPAEVATAALAQLAQNPAPLTLEEILAALAQLAPSRSVLTCLQSCAETPLFTEEAFQSCVGQLAGEKSPRRMLGYLLIIALKAKPTMGSKLCAALGEFTKKGRWSECDAATWSSFVQFVKKCGGVAAELLYWMQPEKVGVGSGCDAAERGLREDSREQGVVFGVYRAEGAADSRRGGSSSPGVVCLFAKRMIVCLLMEIEACI